MEYAKVDGLGFEVCTCGRCGGSGRYSFNQVDGDRCYGCGGTGLKRTKRGAAAHAFYTKSQERPFADLKVGDYVWDDTFGYKGKWLPILALDASQTHGYSEGGGVRNYYVCITTKRSAWHVFPTSSFRSVRDEAHRQELRAAALAYQDTLGVSGKPLKAKKAPAFKHDAPVRDEFGTNADEYSNA